jgi:hypothetical protein
MILVEADVIEGANYSVWLRWAEAEGPQRFPFTVHMIRLDAEESA